jgi:hypothetical protein
VLSQIEKKYMIFPIKFFTQFKTINILFFTGQQSYKYSNKNRWRTYPESAITGEVRWARSSLRRTGALSIFSLPEASMISPLLEVPGVMVGAMLGGHKERRASEGGERDE